MYDLGDIGRLLLLRVSYLALELVVLKLVVKSSAESVDIAKRVRPPVKEKVPVCVLVCL